MSEKQVTENQKEQLHLAQKKVEELVGRKNIFYRTTLDQLIDYEDRISRVALGTGLSIERLIEESGIKSPLEILSHAIRNWKHKLQRGGLGSEQELIERLKTDFQVNVRRTVKEIIPADEREETEDSEGKPGVAPDDANRVEAALNLLLAMNIRGEEILLDDIEVIVGVPPKETWRKRPYWIIDVQKYKVAVFLNNQARNQTFVASYGTKKDLEAMMDWTKKQFKLAKAEGGQIEHFKFHDAAQFEEDLKKAFVNTVEKTVPVPMDEKYFRGQENVRSDLEAFLGAVITSKTERKKKPPETLSDLSTDSVSRVDIICSNGEKVNGFAYLMKAGKHMGLAKDTHKAKEMMKEILDQLKNKAGVELKNYPAMDKSYFVEENIRADLETFAKNFGVRAEELSTAGMDGANVKCNNGETIEGKTYLSRAAKAFDPTIKTTPEAMKVMAKTLGRLKRMIGIEVMEFEAMDRGYFNPGNIARDLEALRVVVVAKGKRQNKVPQSTMELSTYDFKDNEFVCMNGEKVSGLKYLRRAAKAFMLINPPVGKKRENFSTGKVLETLLNELRPGASD